MKKFLLLAFALLAGMGGVVKTHAQEIYAAMEPDGETMVLYYDDQRDSRGGLTDWGIWGHNVTRVVFDESFKAARPISTASWFDGFGGLREIENIDYLNTSEVTDMTFMFYGCSSLETLDVSGFDTHNVTSMSSMFNSCGLLTSLDVSGFQTGNVTDMFGMFADCISLSSLDVSHFDTRNVTDMSFMFWGCQNVEALDVRGFDTRNVTNMQGLFASCLLLSSLDVSGFNTDKVTDMGWMFLVCSSLSTIDVSGFNTDNVTNMSGMFSYCSNVSTIDVSRFNTSKVEGMHTVFEGCSSLTSVAVSGFDTRNATDMHGMFSGCTSLTSLDVSRFDTRNVTDMHGMFSGCPLLTTLDVSRFRTDNVTDMNSMFQNCQLITSLDLDGFRTNIVTDMSYMFQGCEALTELDLGGFNMDNLTNVQGMFDGCVSLRTIVCGADMSQNTGIADSEEMFSNCVQLQGGNGTVYDDAHTDFEYALPDGLNGNWGYFTQPAATEFYAVLEADGITLTFHYDNKRATRGGVTDWSVYMGEVTKVVLAQSVSDYEPTTTSRWFAYFAMLQDADLSNLNTSNVTNMGYMFAGCTMLESVDVSGFDVSRVTDMGGMFSGCSSLERIYCDEDWSQYAISVSEGMFTNCPLLAGGNGTAYNGSHTGLNYALPDGLNGNPGYFTPSGVPELYAVLSTDGTTLTLYYDAQREKKGGVTDWSIFRKFVKKAVLHKSVRNAAPASTAHWFEEFGVLQQIENLTYLNTSAVTDMTGMFYMCQMLESIDLSGFVTSSATSMKEMFFGCFAITSLDVSGFQTGNVTDMNGMFAGCVALASLDISNFDMQSVTDMGYMFSGCLSLVTFEAAGLNTASVEDLSWLFYNCASLETVNISGWSNDKAVRMSNMFTECAALETVNLSGFRTPSVVYLDSMFFDCASLTGLDAGSFDTRNVTDMNSMFAGCASLATVNVSSFNTENVLYLDTMFLGCSSLTSLDLSNFHTNKAMDMSAMFQDCSSLATLDVRNFDTRNVTDMHEMFSGCSSLGMVDVRHFDTGNVTDMGFMFAGCSSLTLLDVSKFKTDNVWRMAGMFLNCQQLDELDVSHFNTANAIEIGYMFADCSSLTTLDVSGFKTEKVTEMQGMFFGCSSLTSLDVSGFNTRMATDMKDMFGSCSSLASLDVSGFNTERVRNMAGMFKDCEKLTWLDVSRFRTENVTDMSFMFSSCASLTFLNVGGFNTDKVTDTEAMFGWCGSLETIYCGDDWSLNAGISNSVDMFYGSRKLKGGNGTKYNDSHFELEYACQDGKYGKPGYFTQPVYFTVTFLDRNYSSIEAEPQQVPYGGTAIAPEAPEEECYDFTGWSRTFDHVVSDLIVYSQYSKITNSVMFLDFYGEQLGSIQFIECGGAATAPPVPEVEGYEFKGWDPADFTHVTEDMWIFAQYEPVSSHVHNWGEPTYKWEGLDCTAKRVCADDAAHVETETVTATLTSTTEPTCTEKGANTYTAVFANGAFDSQTTTTEIPALGHDWVITYMWSEDHATCTATAVCKRDASHTVTEVSTAIATTEDGVTTYTAIFGNSVFEKQTFTETSAPSITVTMSEYGFLSFYADKAYVVPSDLKAYIYTGISGRDLTYQMLTVIPAYTGVFFDGNPNTTYTLYETTTTDDYSSVNMLHGTLSDEVINDGDVHYILTRLEGTTQGGLYWPKGTVNGIGAFTNKAGKAYLSIPASAGVAPRYFTMRGQACEEVTAVDETEAEGDGKYYDILGREVREPQPQQIYIRNGQKVLYTGK